MTPAPERSLQQRLTALERANETRTKRANLKRDLRAGRISVAEVLLEPPEYMRLARVADALLAAPKYGRVKTDQVLFYCRISPTKTLGGLTPRQRTVLVSVLRQPNRMRPAVERRERTPRPTAQAMQALSTANTVRLDRSGIKRQIAAGETTVIEIINEPPSAVLTMTVADLLSAQHRWGTTRTRRLLAAIPLLESKRVGTLTARQRGVLIERLDETLLL